MKEIPAWIKMLFIRGHGLNAFLNRFQLDLHRHFIEELLSEDSQRPKELQSTAKEALKSEDPRTLIQAMSFLLIVGEPADLAAIEPLVESKNASVQNAAKMCRFELQQTAK
jgi:hypothetical protein